MTYFGNGAGEVKYFRWCGADGVEAEAAQEETGRNALLEFTDYGAIIPAMRLLDLPQGVLVALGLGLGDGLGGVVDLHLLAVELGPVEAHGGDDGAVVGELQQGVTARLLLSSLRLHTVGATPSEVLHLSRAIAEVGHHFLGRGL